MQLSDELSPTIQPGNDFFSFVNQRWINQNPIPADKARVGVFEDLMDSNIEKIHTLIEQPSDENEPINIQLLKKYYFAAMDEKRIADGTKETIASVRAKTESLASAEDIFEYISGCHSAGTELVWNPYIEPDDKDSSRYILRFAQAGLGLPDRDYYLESSETFSRVKEQYMVFMSGLLRLSGLDIVDERAQAILGLETELAKISMSATDRRDPDATYNAFDPQELTRIFGGVDWTQYFKQLGFEDSRTTIISQPDFMAGVLRLFSETPIEVWKDYLFVHSLLPLLTKLSAEYDDLFFNFYGKILRGTTEQEPRYRRMIRNCMMSLPEPVGQIFVMAHFDEGAKAEITDMVERLQKAFAARIDKLEWMSDETKAKAHEKLGTFLPLLGYPDTWRDYSQLDVGTVFVSNFQAIMREEWVRSVRRIDKPVDRKEWLMSPALVNAYYWPNTNGITFPAGILQPPFFDATGDFASNFGSIGAVIGHELTHGFDDEGSKFDALGNLNSWWSKDDRKSFDQRAQKLVEQFNGYEVFGRKVNGQLTLGENIADLGGLQMAYDAMKSKLVDSGATEDIEGYSPEQRFFIGFARSWRENIREEFSLQLLVSDPHAPDLYRTNGTVCNIDAFYDAFEVKKEDKLYLAPENRVRIW